MFDPEQPITIKLRTDSGTRAIDVRFPTDAEWTEWRRKRKALIRHLGRGMTEALPAGPEADADLLAKIRTDDGSPLDPYEATRVIEQLALCDVDDVQPEADGYRVSMRVPGGATSVLLRIPSARDVIEFRRSYTRLIGLPRNRQELTINLDAVASLFRKVFVSAEGYAGDVPVIHQEAAVNEVLSELDRLGDEGN